LYDFNPVHDFVGIGAAHIFFFLDDILPYLPSTAGYRLLKAPKFLYDYELMLQRLFL
jgi:hypothetical protein